MSHGTKRSHSESLIVSCIICCGKADRQVFNQKKLFTFITENIIKNYENVKCHLPSAVCTTCRLKDVSKIEWPDYSNWLNILSNIPEASQSSTDCECFVCVKARSKANNKHKRKRGRPWSQVQSSPPECSPGPQSLV